MQSQAFYSSHCGKLSDISLQRAFPFTWRETEAEREGTELCGAAGWSSHKGPLPAPSGQLESPQTETPYPEPPLCSVRPWLAERNNEVSLTGGVKALAVQQCSWKPERTGERSIVLILLPSKDAAFLPLDPPPLVQNQRTEGPRGGEVALGLN